MRLITWHLCNGMNGCDLTGEVEVEDASTPEEIEETVKEDMWNFLSLSWREPATETDS